MLHKLTLKVFESRKIIQILIVSAIVFVQSSNVKASISDSLDVESYNLNLDLTQFKSKQVKGKTTIAVKPLNTTKISRIEFMLFKLKVDSIFIRFSENGPNKKLTFTYNDTIIKINEPLNGKAWLDIFYNGSPSKDASWGGVYFSGNYTFNLGVAFTSEPHNAGRFWFPCNDNFTDKAIFSYNIKCPNGFAAICGGLLIDTLRNADNSIQWQWQHSFPIPCYLASVAMAPYQLLHMDINGNSRTIPAILAAEAKDTNNLRLSFAHLPNALAAFEKYYGPYRFERVGYSLVPFNSGAMEHACNIAYPIYGADGAFSYETVMAHELSHHWWGDNVTCKTAPDMWINEGWASFSEILFLEETYNHDVALNHMRDIHQYVLRACHLADGGATGVSNVSSKNTYGNHVYKKGADMVYTLKNSMTDAEFKNVCQKIMETYKAGNINTADFINYFNTETKIPKRLIEQLVIDTGFCHFSIYNVSSKNVSGVWQNSISYKQRNRFARHIYDSMPFDITFFDKNFRKYSYKVYLGNASDLNVSTNFKPEFTCFDFDQKFSDAITDDAVLTDKPGAYNMSYSMVNMNITELKDTSLIRIEHNWVHPDAYFMNIPGVIISAERYWKVDGIIDPSLKATLQFNYDGSSPTNYSSGWLDNQLLKNSSEDSIVLLYRPNPQSYWQVETNATKTMGVKIDKKGSFLVNQFKTGEYAFGIKGKAIIGKVPRGYTRIENKIHVFPNPSNDSFTINMIEGEIAASVQIYNAQGQLVMRIKPDFNAEIIKVATENWPSGNYHILINTTHKKQYTSEVIIAH